MAGENLEDDGVGEFGSLEAGLGLGPSEEAEGERGAVADGGEDADEQLRVGGDRGGVVAKGVVSGGGGGGGEGEGEEEARFEC